MLDAISSAFTQVIQMVGTVMGSFVHETGALRYFLPMIGFCIAMGVLGFAIRTIKSLVWGF